MAWAVMSNLRPIETTFACMKAAFDSGINFFDCAEGYAGGESEKVMGEAIKKFGWKRNDLVISTKVGRRPPSEPGSLSGSTRSPHADREHALQLYWGGAFSEKKVNSTGLSRKHIIEGMAMSLERLQLDYVDLIFAHRPDRHTPMEETVRAFNYLIDKGQALYWGTSEWNADEIAQAWRVADRLGLVGPVMEQPCYNMLDREKVEREYAHLYRDPGLGLTVFSPLKQGILSGKYKDGIPPGSRFAQEEVEFIRGHWKRTTKETWDGITKQVAKLEPIAQRLGITQSHLALAWVLANPNVSSAITGASSPEQVYDNVAALAAVSKLTPEIMKEIDDILNNKPPAPTMRF